MHGHHQKANTKIRLIIFFAAKDGEALYSQQKQGWELTMAQIMNSLLTNSDLNWRKWGKTTRPFRYDLNQIPYDYTVEVRNRFKGLHLIDRVPDELWTEVHDIVQETGIKTIPMEKKCKKAEWLSEEGLQIAWFYLVHKSSLVGTEWKLTLSPHSLSLGWFQKWGRHSIIKGWWFGKARSHHDSPRSHSP